MADFTTIPGRTRASWPASSGHRRRIIPRAVVVTVEGDLDAESLDQFAATCLQSFERTDEAVVVDMSHSDFVSVEATQVLVDTKARAHRAGLDLRIVTATRGVERALAVTGTRHIFAYHTTVESAMTDGRENAQPALIN